jgi:hypothetical protein
MQDLLGQINALRNYRTRPAARRKLLECGPEGVGDQLLESLKDEDLPENAAWATMSLFAEWRWQPAFGRLVELLEQRPSLCGETGRFLAQISGVDLGSAAERWKRYLQAPDFFSLLRDEFAGGELLSFEVVDGYCKIYLEVNGLRRHEVLLYKKDDSYTIYTECGLVPSGWESSVEEYNP